MCISVAKLQNILDVTKQIMKIFLTFFRVKYNVFERQIVREIYSMSFCHFVILSESFEV